MDREETHVRCGGFTRGSTDWRPQLEIAVQILDLTNKHEVALKVQIITDRLLRLETEEATVTNDEFKFMERIPCTALCTSCPGPGPFQLNGTSVSASFIS